MLGFALSTTTAAGVVYLSRQRKHLSLAPYPHVTVFSVIFLISWSGLSSLVDTHTAHRGAKGGRRIIRKKTRPKYMRVVLLYTVYAVASLLSSFALSRPYRNCQSLSTLSLSLSPENSTCSKWFIHFDSPFRMQQQSLALYPKGNTLLY